MIEASSGGGLSFALLPRLGEYRCDTHYCSLWNAGYDCPRSKFALVFAVFGNGRLPSLHLRHLSTVSCRSPSQERILHSKLHIPAIIAGHSAALARLLSPIFLGFRSGNRAIFAAIRRASSRGQQLRSGLQNFSAELFHECPGHCQIGKTPSKIDLALSDNPSSMPRLNFSRPTKVHDAAAQVDIQFIIGEGDLDNVRISAFVDDRLPGRWLAH
jgi:hypothetical protein